MYKGNNTSDNPGNVNVEYFLLDKVTIDAEGTYTFFMNVTTDRTYKYLKNAKVKVQLRDAAASDANVICELGEIDLYFDGDGSGKTKSLTFGSAPTEGYVCFVYTGELVGQIYKCIFSDFSIGEPVSESPVIMKQPETSLNIDVDNVPTLSVTAYGKGLAYKWYYQFPRSTWISLDETGPSLKLPFFHVGYKFKCVVSNAAGEVETDPTTVEHITLHGTECPESSGKYYANFVSGEYFTIDEHTVAYKAVLNETEDAISLVHVRQDDSFIPNRYTSKGLVLESSNRDIVLSMPSISSGSYTTSYDDNALLDSRGYNKRISYVMGVKNGRLAMYPGTENEIPFYTAYYNGSGLNTEHPDGLELILPAQYTIVFDKNAEEATGTMPQQTLFDDGNTVLRANAFSRTNYKFMGWSTSPNGAVELTDKQLVTTAPAAEGNTVTLYAKWKRELDDDGCFIIDGSEDWGLFCKYVEDTDNGVNAKLTADITEAVTEMAGTSGKPYTGTFDGGGHTLTVNYETRSEDCTAPFRYTKGATIENLTVEGLITTSKKFAGGVIAYNADGSSVQTVLRCCVSNVTIVSEVRGDGTHGGLVGVNNNDDMVIEHCAFTGALIKRVDVMTDCCGGLVGWSNGTAVVRNCLLSATFAVSSTGSNTFVRNNATVSNCYYVNALGDVPEGATQIESETLSSGEALRLLGSAWAQKIGTHGDKCPTPYLESRKATANYVYNDGTGWVCENYLLGDKETVEIGLDFTAKSLTYGRTFTLDDGYYTVYVPFAIPTTNGKLYSCTCVNAQKSEAVFAEATSPEANTPYIFKPTVTQLDLGSNVEVKKTTDIADSSNGCLRGVNGFLTFTDDNRDGCYGYAAESRDGYKAGAFVRFGSGATVPAGRAYIYAPEAVNAKRLNVVIDGETTGIAIPVAGGVAGAAPCYNLSGQQVGEDYKGVVVTNGKKMVKK